MVCVNKGIHDWCRVEKRLCLAGTERTCKNKKPMTKADRIRSMSDEGLAMLLAESQVVMAELMLKQFGIDFTFSDANKEKIARKAMEAIQQPWEEE